MKHFYSKISSWLTMLALVLVAAPLSMQAQVQMQEDFSEHIVGGNLVGLEGWMQYQYNENSPIKVSEGALPYADYPQGVSGNSVMLAAGDANSDAMGSLQKSFRVFSTQKDESDAANKKYGVTAGAIYYSALVKIDAIAHDEQYIMTLVRKQSFSASRPWADKNSGTETGRLYTKVSADGKGFHFGVHPATSTQTAPIAYSEQALEYGKTYLIVVKYEINADNNGQDNMYLYVNPSDFVNEPTAATAKFDAAAVGFDKGVKTVSKKTMGFEAIELAQSGSATYLGNAATISMLRVADTWKNIFVALPKDTTPKLTVAPATLNFSTVLQNSSVTAEVLVKGKYLTSDVKVAAEGQLAASINNITKDEANKGVRMNLTLTATKALSAGDTTAYVVFSTAGLEDTRMEVKWVTIPIIELANLKEAASIQPQGGAIYQLKSKVVITHVGAIPGDWSPMPVYYFEDETAGGYLIDQAGAFMSLGLNYEVGDSLKNIQAEMMAPVLPGCAGNFFMPSMSSQNPSMGDVISKGNVVAPKAISAEEFVNNYANYTNRLVKVDNVNAKNDANFSCGTPVVMINGANEFNVDLFANSDLEGVAAGADALSITGISTSDTAPVLKPRSKEDVVKYTATGIHNATAAEAATTVYDMSGRKIVQLDKTTQIKHLPAGLYIIKSGNQVKKVQVK